MVNDVLIEPIIVVNLFTKKSQLTQHLGVTASTFNLFHGSSQCLSFNIITSGSQLGIVISKNEVNYFCFIGLAPSKI